jgi:uncharacterized protein YciI
LVAHKALAIASHAQVNGGAMRMFVLLSRFQQSLDEINQYLAPHSAWVQRHYASGRFLVSGRRVPPVGGVIVARASSEEEIQAILASDPLQRLGLVVYEVCAFDAADFPKRSSAFDAFASQPLSPLSSIQAADS